MKLVLFVGHHKVGSTALQLHLSRTAPDLAARGVLYPVVSGRDRGRLRGGAVALLPPSRNVTEAHSALAFTMLAEVGSGTIPDFHSGLPSSDEMLALVRQQCADHRPHTLLMVSEVFANFASFPALIARLVDGLQPDAVEIVVYLRRVDDYLASWHAQRIRMGHTVRALPHMIGRYARTIHLDYRLLVEAWLTALPGAEVSLQSYEEAVASGGTVHHFMAQHGLPAPDADEPRVNEGLHRAYLELMRQANRALPAGAASDLFRTALRRPLQDGFPASSDVELFGDKARKRLVQRFQPIDAWLTETAGRRLLPPPSEMRHKRPVAQHEASRLARDALLGLRGLTLSREARAFLRDIELAANT